MEGTATLYDRTALVKLKGPFSSSDLVTVFAELQAFSQEFPIIVVSFHEGRPPPGFAEQIGPFKTKVKVRSQVVWASRHHPQADGPDRVAALMALRTPEATRVADVLRLHAEVAKIRKTRDELRLKQESILRKCLGRPAVTEASPEADVRRLEHEFALELEGKRELFAMLSAGSPGVRVSASPPVSPPTDTLAAIRRLIMQKLGRP